MYRGGDKHWFEKVDFRSNHLTGLVAGMTALCWNENTVYIVPVTIRRWIGSVNCNAAGRS